MTERLTGISFGIQVKADNVVPICFNNAPGEGNCPGMVKYNNCPQTRGAVGKFSDCTQYVENFADKCACCKR